MMMVYDMNTGRIIETRQQHNAAADSIASAYERHLALGLQELPPSRHFHEERQIPPELVIADLNAFLQEMS